MQEAFPLRDGQTTSYRLYKIKGRTYETAISRMVEDVRAFLNTN